MTAVAVSFLSEDSDFRSEADSTLTLLVQTGQTVQYCTELSSSCVFLDHSSRPGSFARAAGMAQLAFEASVSPSRVTKSTGVHALTCQPTKKASR